MAFYTFDENTFSTFDSSRIVIEEGKQDIGAFKVSYFNIKYKNDDGASCQIKVKTPILITPFGINKNQFGKTQLTVNLPQGPLHTFLETFQSALKTAICNNIKTYNKASTKAKIPESEFDILSTAFDIIKPHKEGTKYDDTMTFDFTSVYDQQNTKFFDSDKKVIDNILFADDCNDDNHISNVVPPQTQMRIVFKINSICMYGETKARKFTIKKNPAQILIVERPMDNNTCEFSDDDPVDEEEEGEENDTWSE